MDQEVKAILAEIAENQARVMEEMAELSKGDLRYKTTQWRWNTTRRVMLRFGDHIREHTTQLIAAREDIGAAQTMPQRMLARAQEAYGFFLGAMVGLTDEDLDKAPAEGEWTIRQVLEHIRHGQPNYIRLIQDALEAGEMVEKD